MQQHVVMSVQLCSQRAPTPPSEDSVPMDKQSELTGVLGLWRVSPLTTALGAVLPIKEGDSTQCHTQGATLVVQ